MSPLLPLSLYTVLPSDLTCSAIDTRRLADLEPLLEALGRIGASHQGKSVAQVSLNWLICKGVVPIPGARNAAQAEENCGALGWRLTDEQVAELDELSQTFADFPGMPLETM